MERINLNGKWTLFDVNKKYCCDATVPGTNYFALMEQGIIPDPFYKTNEKDVQWVGREDWYFKRKFELSEDALNYDNVFLVCNELDTLCDIYINGKKAGSANNAHIAYEFDVKEFLNEGSNEIEILFHSPVDYSEGLQKEKPLPNNPNGTNGISYIRKPACHFGWDWGISLPFSGITGDIEICAFNSRITSLSVEQEIKDEKAVLKIKTETQGECDVDGEIACPNGSKISFNSDNAEVVIENPELWTIRELSGKENQPLYTVTVSCEENSKSKKIGIRTLELRRNKDEFGSEFRFYLNGVPLFAKGANWIPPDAVVDRYDTSVLEYYIDCALNANFNMIRVWGGGKYESEEFYNMCDEKGILVWQDFCYACLMYPFYEKDFLENCLAEARQNILRLKDHASLALLCGNNEIETMYSYLPENSKLVKWYKKYFYEILFDEVNTLAPSVSYIPTSPIGSSFRKGVTGDAHGDTHMWNVWHGQKKLKYYRKRPSRFCSEFGLESLPCVDAIKMFADDRDLSLESEVFLAHQKCKGGNAKMLYYLLERYNEPKTFSDTVYLTGLVQKNCIEDATEFWRRSRKRCAGSLFWQYNDNWYAPSWSAVDYSGKWKPLMYAAKRFFEPVCVSINESSDDFEVFTINDTQNSLDVKLKISLCKFSGEKLFEKTVSGCAKALSSQRVFSKGIKGFDKRNLYLCVDMISNGKVISRRTKTFIPDKKLSLPKAQINIEKSFNDGILAISLESSVYCKDVFLNCEGVSKPLSDNCFDLLPNERKTVYVECENENVNIECKTLGNVEYKGTNAQAKAYRAKFFIKPENIANTFWYTIN